MSKHFQYAMNLCSRQKGQIGLKIKYFNISKGITFTIIVRKCLRIIKIRKKLLTTKI